MFFNLSERSYRLNHQAGYSLLELTIVVLILGIMAAAVVPSFFSARPEKLDLAAREFADTIRFARSEAMRLGQPMGFWQQSSAKSVRVFRVDTDTVPWGLVYDVYHPVSKKLYHINLNSHAFASADSLSHNRVFRGTCNQPDSVYFDAAGTPRCVNPETVPLDRLEITLTLGSDSRLLILNGINGQVTIQ